MPKVTKCFCVGHVPPLFRAPVDFQMLCPSSLGMKDEIVVQDDRFGPGIDGASLAEYSQLFALSEMLSAGEIVADNLFLFQYRKFVSPHQGGVEGTASWVRLLTGSEGHSLFPSAELLASVPARVIVGSLLDVRESLPGYYARVHVIDDLVMFTAACARSGHLSEADIKQFSTMHGMIPSPALCFVNTDLFLKIMGILKGVWELYYPHYHVVRTGYQRRVAGYLLERLHSFLLTKWLMDGSEPDINLWQRYVVLE